MRTGEACVIMHSARLEAELLLFWFCLHGEALKQQHSGHPVNGAAIQTQLTAAACDRQPVAPGGSSLGARTGLLSPCGPQTKVGAPTKPPTKTPSPMAALVRSGTSGRCWDMQPVLLRRPRHPRLARDSLPKATCGAHDTASSARCTMPALLLLLAAAAVVPVGAASRSRLSTAGGMLARLTLSCTL